MLLRRAASSAAVHRSARRLAAPVAAAGAAGGAFAASIGGTRRPSSADGAPKKGGGGRESPGGFFDGTDEWISGAGRGARRFLDELGLSGDKGCGTKDGGEGIEAPPEGERREVSIFDRIRDAFESGGGGGGGGSSAPDAGRKSGDEDGLFSLTRSFASLISGAGDEAAVRSLINRARRTADGGGVSEERRSFAELVSLLEQTVREVDATMERMFGHLDLGAPEPTALFYYLEREDERKNPSWKRRMHRYHGGVNVAEVNELNNSLTLADLSYEDTVDQIRDGLADAKEGWELIYCKTDSHPGEPGHFLALNRGQSRWSGSLDVLLVVRGTKSVPDMLTDALCEAADYRGGKAHKGCLRAGRYLVEKHGKLLDDLLEMSGKRRINLTIIGHSLGAAAATIAGMELNDRDTIDARVIGFGCPALLSQDLSESVRPIVTTVVGDADVIPRTSAASIANLLLDVSEHDWTCAARRDVEQALTELRRSAPALIGPDDVDRAMGFVDGIIEKRIRPRIKPPSTERMELMLFPPGTCVHFYRDGSGISGSFAPCTFFNEIDVARTMVDDHLIKYGYKRIFLELMRQHHRDEHFAFGEKRGSQ